LELYPYLQKVIQKFRDLGPVSKTLYLNSEPDRHFLPVRKTSSNAFTNSCQFNALSPSGNNVIIIIMFSIVYKYVSSLYNLASYLIN